MKLKHQILLIFSILLAAGLFINLSAENELKDTNVKNRDDVIEIFLGEKTYFPYMEVAHVAADELTSQKAVEKLKELAAELDADAILNFSNFQSNGGFVAKGLAVRWSNRGD